MTIAALFVEPNGVYFGLPDVDPWDVTRDARCYLGPHPVVAHPPCARWAYTLAPLNERRYGYPVGDDGGCFADALGSVRAYGGVLEHPAHSLAWGHFGLTKPHRGRWTACGSWDGSWVCEISQSAYGHRAVKRTWLYYVGESAPSELRWDSPSGTAVCSYQKTKGKKSKLPVIAGAEASRTPEAFRDELIALAIGSRK